MHSKSGRLPPKAVELTCLEFSINLFRWKGGGGGGVGALMHVYVLEHIASLYYRTA